MSYESVIGRAPRRLGGRERTTTPTMTQRESREAIQWHKSVWALLSPVLGQFAQLLDWLFYMERVPSKVQSWAKERALGCVNSQPAARGSQEAAFTQPRAHSFAHPCTLDFQDLFENIRLFKYPACICMKLALQSLPKKFVLGCIISPLRQQAESSNLGHTFLANSVVPK